jgi:hypothetical protein
MTDKTIDPPLNETFTWLQPGAWRNPCIVHVTMVASLRQALFGQLAHNGSEAIVEKTPIGWALINQERRMQTVTGDSSVTLFGAFLNQKMAAMRFSQSLSVAVLIFFSPKISLFGK